jgi:acyl-homoserine lactone acylase PvdQ
MQKATFEDWQKAAFDTEVYWARKALPKFAAELEKLKAAKPQTAEAVRPYLEHLLGWDCRITAASTEATLCEAWYEMLYGPGYPGEKMRKQFEGKPEKQFAALVSAAQKLIDLHGKWKVPYGELFRVQRQPEIGDLVDLRFSDSRPSLPSLGGHGPMGVALTQYYSPSIDVPFLISQKKRYGIVGTSYLAAWEFAPEGVRGASLVPLGVSGDPDSPHYFDQAKLLSEQRLKPEHFTEQQVARNAARSYHPGAN